jgi:hypothetical protein
MIHKKKNLILSDRETLLQVIDELQLKLRKKNADIMHLRTKLTSAKAQLSKMKDTVQFQRKRILELYP